jgi:pilus assembly protein Flp/PilA
MRDFLKKYAKSESGASAIEYGLIAAGIALAIMAVVFSLGSNVGETLYSSLPALFD